MSTDIEPPMPKSDAAIVKMVDRLQKDLSAREAELADLREGLYSALGGVSPSDAELIEVARIGRDARAQLATVTASHREWVEQNSACPPIVPGGVVKEMRTLKDELATVRAALEVARWQLRHNLDPMWICDQIDSALAAHPATDPSKCDHDVTCSLCGTRWPSEGQ
jgi:hypothetical protein